MTEYYRGPCARITDELFESSCPTHQTFAISELGSVHVVEGGSGGFAGLSLARVCSTGIAGVAAVVAVAGSSITGSAQTSMFALLVLVAAAVAAVVAWRTPIRPHELWGVHRGELVCLFQSTDRIAFGQVRRALVRVFEQIADAR
jgi:hypothetical protein